MSPHDSGVTELLRRASDDLTPDVDRLVRGGITRGRSRQRRARIGTTVASLAVIGVVGALAAVVPQLDGADSARDPGIATEGPSATATPTAEPPAPATTERALADFRAAQVPSIVNGIVGTGLAAEPRPTDTLADDDDEKIAYFPYDGMEAAVVVMFNQLLSVARCEEVNARSRRLLRRAGRRHGAADVGADPRRRSDVPGRQRLPLRLRGLGELVQRRDRQGLPDRWRRSHRSRSSS